MRRVMTVTNGRPHVEFPRPFSAADSNPKQDATSNGVKEPSKDANAVIPWPMLNFGLAFAGACAGFAWMLADITAKLENLGDKIDIKTDHLSDKIAHVEKNLSDVEKNLCDKISHVEKNAAKNLNAKLDHLEKNLNAKILHAHVEKTFKC